MCAAPTLCLLVQAGLDNALGGTRMRVRADLSNDHKQRQKQFIPATLHKGKDTCALVWGLPLSDCRKWHSTELCPREQAPPWRTEAKSF